ncbi:hypothetical protein PR048_009085 [Dryococelus australis]|uniref:Uncharacterized protein n=1 Tax=Dryococelus australis TaxID=614101 RepID=A0ABQ9HZZ0_9NEOP|nr:hypothetical protein PR048_009085 [Dryococelus australis]
MHPRGLLKKPAVPVWDQFRLLPVIPGAIGGIYEGEWNSWIQFSDFEAAPIVRRKRQVCEWVKASWDAVKTETVVKSFKKFGISNTLDGTENVV